MDQFRSGPGLPILSAEIDHYYWILDRKYNLEPTLVHAAVNIADVLQFY